MEQKLDLIIQKLENIEAHLGIKRTICDQMHEAYTVSDTAKILGCTQRKTRQYIAWGMLETFQIGKKKMITSPSIKKLISEHKGN